MTSDAAAKAVKKQWWKFVGVELPVACFAIAVLGIVAIATIHTQSVYRSALNHHSAVAESARQTLGQACENGVAKYGHKHIDCEKLEDDANETFARAVQETAAHMFEHFKPLNIIGCGVNTWCREMFSRFIEAIVHNMFICMAFAVLVSFICLFIFGASCMRGCKLCAEPRNARDVREEHVETPKYEQQKEGFEKPSKLVYEEHGPTSFEPFEVFEC